MQHKTAASLPPRPWRWVGRSERSRGLCCPTPERWALPEERRSGCCGEMPGTHAAPGPGGRSAARNGALAGVTPEPRGSPATSVLSAHSGWDPHVHSYSGARPLSSLRGLDSESGGPRPRACGTMMAPSLWARRAWSLCKEDDHAAQDTGTVMYVHIRRYKRNMLTSVQSRSVCRIHGPLPSHSRQATIVPTAGMAHGGPARLGPYWHGCGWHCSPGGLAPAPHVTLPSPVHTVPSWWAHGQRGRSLGAAGSGAGSPARPRAPLCARRGPPGHGSFLGQTLSH